MHTTPLAPPTHDRPSDPVAIARGLIAAAMGGGAGMPDAAALDLAAAWDALEEPGRAPYVVLVSEAPELGLREQLLRARVVLRQAIPAAPGGRRALALAAAIRHLDAAVSRVDGWTGGGWDQ